MFKEQRSCIGGLIHTGYKVPLFKEMPSPFSKCFRHKGQREFSSDLSYFQNYKNRNLLSISFIRVYTFPTLLPSRYSVVDLDSTH